MKKFSKVVTAVDQMATSLESNVTNSEAATEPTPGDQDDENLEKMKYPPHWQHGIFCITSTITIVDGHGLIL